MKLAVIIPAAGASTRFGFGDKLSQDLGGRAILLRAVEAFVKRTVKETVNKDDGTTELKQLSKVNKPHLVQALLTLAAAKNGSSVPDKKKLDALRRASLVQMVFEVVCAGLRPPSHEPGVGR